jgi:hypothetical protein
MALGLTGRYLGGQATQQWQRFDARGGDPDQFAGWFCQCMGTAITLPVMRKAVYRVHAWKPSRWSVLNLGVGNPVIENLRY